MNKVEKISHSHIEVAEFIYSNREMRDTHISEMEALGWFDSGSKRKLKDGVSILDATDQDYVWYSRLTKHTK